MPFIISCHFMKLFELNFIEYKEKKQYMKWNYRKDFKYQDLAPLFKAELWQPKQWASLFQEARAKLCRVDVWVEFYGTLIQKTKLLTEMNNLVRIYKPDLLWSDRDDYADSAHWKDKQFLSWLFNERWHLAPETNEIICQWPSRAQLQLGSDQSTADTEVSMLRYEREPFEVTPDGSEGTLISSAPCYHD
ncbi:hypothetical protein CAPTEDRAFT_215135 [Capitella teleta]|uniref:alpha-L-fucosidase n=1 Tax=Capitella teleta TaxID=283909 RepID=R7THH4_CAPTE|nr:hypothetical protein CAPTEDRAFT_215135 [Capitella teleta]|eukprot:ELT93253.1 hypothetical protein CAPTEDRAFT_215135 [Capitella teleta]